MINTNRLDEFMLAYCDALRAQHKAHPESYGYSEDMIPGVLVKMRSAFADGAGATGPWPANGPSMKLACKTCGVKPTYKALGAFLRGGS